MLLDAPTAGHVELEEALPKLLLREVVRLSFAHDLYEIRLGGEGGANILARRAHFSAVADIARGMPAMAK